MTDPKDLPAPPKSIDVPPQFEFKMRVTEKDQSGYYYPNWDRQQRLTVIAATKDEAYQKACAVMGESPRGRGWVWTARYDQITEVER